MFIDVDNDADDDDDEDEVDDKEDDSLLESSLGICMVVGSTKARSVVEIGPTVVGVAAVVTDDVDVVEKIVCLVDVAREPELKKKIIT